MVLIDYEVRDLVSSLDRGGHASLDFSRKIKETAGGAENELISLKTFQLDLMSERRRRVDWLCRDLLVTNDHIHMIERRLRDAIRAGLDRETQPDSSVKCYPTYVTKLPTGEEDGKFLALDLGGTNFRVLLMEIGKQGKFQMESKIFSVERSVMVGTGEALFDHIADCLASFLHERNLQGENLPLGFTFSFPLVQEGLTVGRLAQWTKGFKCSSVEGRDVVELLKEAIRRRGDISIDVVAILNDTTGTLMSSAWREPKCRIGLILGTGTNACYLEDIKNIETINPDDFPGQEHMVINTEWGAFGDNGELEFVRTKWDLEVDRMSLNPGKQTFEKMISGMYMGELVRLVILDMMDEGLIFQNQNTNKLRYHGTFPTSFLSEVEADPVGEYGRSRTVLFSVGVVGASEADLSALRTVCEAVSRRAAFMCAAGITALLKKMDYRDVTIAVDGSLFRHHPHFHNVIKSRVAQLMGIDYKFDLLLSEDGSGRGAALVAAVLQNRNSPQQKMRDNYYCNIM